MARYPEIGAVKTRLARTVGAERACALYRAFLQDLTQRFTDQRRVLVWAFHPPDSDFAAIVSPGARCLPQAGADLAERMYNAFSQLCGEFDRVIMIGVDAPHVRNEWLDEAERSLEQADIVLGPSDDGGYYLVAMRHPHDVFRGVTMGTTEVFEQTRRIADAKGLRLQLLPHTFDVDEAEDLARLRTLLQSDRIALALPATVRLLREWS